MADIDALIATFPTQVQNNALRAVQTSIDQQNLAQNALTMRENAAGENALRQIYARGAVDPRTGLPPPGAMGPLVQANPSMGLDMLQTIGKLRDTQARTDLTNLKTMYEYNDIYVNNVAKPLITYDEELQAKGIAPQQRQIMVEQKRKELTNHAQSSFGLPDNVIAAADVPFDSTYPARVQMNQQRQENTAKGWKGPFTDSTGKQYWLNSYLGPGAWNADRTAPTTITGEAEGKGLEPFIDRTKSGPVPIEYNSTTGKYTKNGAAYTPENPQKIGTDTTAKASQFGTENDLMQRWHQDFLSKNQREPTTDEIAAQRQELTKQTRPVGRQLAQMTQRLMIGANEVSKAVGAMSKLPMGTTLGWFGGAQATMGPDLAENLRKALANKATPESAQVLKTLSNGVSRGLAILESGGSAQGLVGLSNQLQNDIPQENDTGLTIAAKFADIRQIVEAATEVLDSNPDIQDKQKTLIKSINSGIGEAIPFTTSDVARLVGKPSDERLNQFAKRIGLGGERDTGDLTKRKYKSLDEAIDDLPNNVITTAPDGTQYRKDDTGKVHKKPVGAGWQ